MLCTIKDVKGNPIEGVKIDIWETDSTGHYDVQHSDRQGPDGRCVMNSDKEGVFWFKAIVPVPYPIPHDGPVGQLLKLLNRHPWRPAHMHFMFEKKGWDHLITYVFLSIFPKFGLLLEMLKYSLFQSPLYPQLSIRDLRCCFRRQEITDCRLQHRRRGYRAEVRRQRGKQGVET